MQSMEETKSFMLTCLHASYRSLSQVVWPCHCIDSYLRSRGRPITAIRYVPSSKIIEIAPISPWEIACQNQPAQTKSPQQDFQHQHLTTPPHSPRYPQYTATMGRELQKRKNRSSRPVIRQSNRLKKPLNPMGNSLVAKNWSVFPAAHSPLSHLPKPLAYNYTHNSGTKKKPFPKTTAA